MSYCRLVSKGAADSRQAVTLPVPRSSSSKAVRNVGLSVPYHIADAGLLANDQRRQDRHERLPREAGGRIVGSREA